MENPYIPFLMRIEDVILETEDRKIKTFVLAFVNEEDRKSFVYVPGQFAEISVFGKGEAPFGMASTPTRPEYLEFSVSTIGVVTGALHNLGKGDIVGVRGPLGNGYPLETFQGKNLLLIGGGFGFSTLRSLTNYILHGPNRTAFGGLTVVYGARKPGLLLYKADLEAWKERSDISLHLTVDQEADGWKGHVGLVPNITRTRSHQSEEHLRRGVRATGNDEVYPTGAEGPGISGRRHPFLFGDADEMRHRKMRPLQHGEQVCLH